VLVRFRRDGMAGSLEPGPVILGAGSSWWVALLVVEDVPEWDCHVKNAFFPHFSPVPIFSTLSESHFRDPQLVIIATVRRVHSHAPLVEVVATGFQVLEVDAKKLAQAGS
jgi:hypothetical protein